MDPRIDAPKRSHSCTVAGVKFIGDYKTKLAKLQPGDDVYLQCEPTNAYDPNAILVLTADGTKLGYVPAADTHIIHKMVAHGHDLRTVIMFLDVTVPPARCLIITINAIHASTTTTDNTTETKPA